MTTAPKQAAQRASLGLLIVAFQTLKEATRVSQRYHTFMCRTQCLPAIMVCCSSLRLCCTSGTERDDMR